MGKMGQLKKHQICECSYLLPLANLASCQLLSIFNFMGCSLPLHHIHTSTHLFAIMLRKLIKTKLDRLVEPKTKYISCQNEIAPYVIKAKKLSYQREPSFYNFK